MCGSYPGPDANDVCTSQPKSSGHPISVTRIGIPSPTVHPPALPLFCSRLTPVSQLDFPVFSECFRSDELTDTSEDYLYKSHNRPPKFNGSEEWSSHLLVEDCELPPNPPSTPPLSSYDQPNRHRVYPHLHAPRRHLLGIARPSHYALSPPPLRFTTFDLEFEVILDGSGHTLLHANIPRQAVPGEPAHWTRLRWFWHWQYPSLG